MVEADRIERQRRGGRRKFSSRKAELAAKWKVESVVNGDAIRYFEIASSRLPFVHVFVCDFIFPDL